MPRFYQVEDEENLELMRLIDEEFLRHPFYGSCKMKAYLCRKGNSVNRKRSQRLMRLMSKEYFEVYNLERPHQSLGGKTPAEIYWGREVARKAA